MLFAGVAFADAVCVGVAVEVALSFAGVAVVVADGDGVGVVVADGDGVGVSAIAPDGDTNVMKSATAAMTVSTQRPKGRLFRGVDTIPSFKGSHRPDCPDDVASRIGARKVSRKIRKIRC